MKRINFSNYIRNLPSNIVLDYLNGTNSLKILTNTVYEDICRNFCTQENIFNLVEKISQEAKTELFQIYLCGDFGKKASSGEIIKYELLKTFLTFEGTDENLLFGFPDLSETIAKIFARQAVSHETSGAHLSFFATFFNDATIILDMLENGEGKICGNGTYSQRFTELIKERCGVGKLLEKHDDLTKILDMIIEVSKFFGAEFSKSDGKITLLSNAYELLEKIVETAAKNPLEMLEFTKAVNFSFLETLVSGSENTAKINDSFSRNTDAEINFSLKVFHWIGIAECFADNSFKLKKPAEIQYQKGHVLPDFNVYIPIETDPLHLNKILHSVKITDVDVIYRGKIDKKRVEESLANGIHENDIVEILQIWDVAPSIKKTIAEWIYSFKRAFLDLPYIAFRNDIAPSIAKYSDLKEKITPIEGYTFFAVKSGEEKSVVETLEKFGFDLRRCKEKQPLPLTTKTKIEDGFIKFNENPLSKTPPPSRSPTKYSGLMIPFSPENRTLLNYAVVMEKNIKIESFDAGAATETYKILDVANGFLKVEDEEKSEKNIPYAAIKKIGIDE